jgi:hypothetical protein
MAVTDRGGAHVCPDVVTAPCELLVGVELVVGAVVVVVVVAEADPELVEVLGSEEAVAATAARPEVAAEWVPASLATRAPRPIPVDTEATPIMTVARRIRHRARSRTVGSGDGRRRPPAEVGWSRISRPFGRLGPAGLHIRIHTGRARIGIPDLWAIGQADLLGQLRSGWGQPVSIAVEPSHSRRTGGSHPTPKTRCDAGEDAEHVLGQGATSREPVRKENVHGTHP